MKDAKAVLLSVVFVSLVACGGGDGTGGGPDGLVTSTSGNVNDLGPIDAALIDTSVACDVATGTPVAGGNVQGNWTTAGSPYIINADITIAGGTTLTIDPGVNVCIADTDAAGSGLDPNRVEITVIGTLNLEGTPAMPIILRSIAVSDSAGEWYGIVADATALDIKIEYVYLKNAVHGFLGQRDLTIANTVLKNNADGLRMAATANVASTVFLENGSGIHVLNSGAVQVSSSLFYENTYAIYSLSNASSNLIYNNTIYRSVFDGIYLGSTSGTANHVLTNNIIILNGRYGVRRVNLSSPAASSFNNVWRNGIDDFFQLAAGTGSLSSNPDFVFPPYDFRLKATSVSIDSGTDNGVNFDIIGTARPIDYKGGGAIHDMGAYENIP